MFVASNSVPQLPYSTRLDKFFSLCFFTCFLLFFYHVFMYLMVERMKKAAEEASKGKYGSFSFCCRVLSCSANGASTPPPPSEVTAVAITADPKAANSKAPAAAPTAPAATPAWCSPATFFRYALANIIMVDLAASFCFIISFSVATVLLLRTSTTA